MANGEAGWIGWAKSDRREQLRAAWPDANSHAQRKQARSVPSRSESGPIMKPGSSTKVKLPGSSTPSMRSRIVSRPRACCLATASAPPSPHAISRIRSTSSSRSRQFMAQAAAISARE